MAHWYSNDGTCAYTQISTKGKDRPTTLADARKKQLWPSVTTIIAGAAAPGLDNYRQEQMLAAALKFPVPVLKLDMTDEIYEAQIKNWKRKVVEESKVHSQEAARRGSEIHDALEYYYKNNKYKEGNSSYSYIVDIEDGIPIMIYYSWVDALAPIIKFLEEKFPNAQWVAEQSFTHMRYGYGGKVDLHDPVNKIVLDFKTKDTDDIKKMKAYATHHMQSAAYAVGLNVNTEVWHINSNNLDGEVIKYNQAREWKRYNLFISTQVPGLLNLTESTDFDTDWSMFESLLRYWQLSNGHYPGKYK